ncbi:hypothetical protein AACH06_26615 [Ideonella sp. DXS29W]|uniref:DUF3551 domain-containing protein n=1 Tax=Ideonella lacteola TaxID=2984193 RepID=A0ABU9BWR0_9BURK
MTLRSFAKPRSRAAGLLMAAFAGVACAAGAPPAPEQPAGRLMADWPRRLSEAGCPPLSGKPDERRCNSRDSFTVCKEAVDAGHLKRCHLADTRETYPASR